MEIVVVGVDGSDTAAKAAARAATLAAGLGGQLVVVNAFDGSGEQPPQDLPGDLPPFSVHDGAVAVAQEAIDALRSDFPDLQMTPQAEIGKPADVLVRVAEKLSATVVVVGNKRVQGISRVLGSIARDVAQHAPCDVFVAHTVDR